LFAKGKGEKERRDLKEKGNIGVPYTIEKNEFPREFNVHNLRTGCQFIMEPTPTELKQLAERFKLENIVDMKVLINSSPITTWHCTKGSYIWTLVCV
jgi:hypothetical protein